jgi:hypothetical protein
MALLKPVARLFLSVRKVRRGRAPNAMRRRIGEELAPPLRIILLLAFGCMALDLGETHAQPAASKEYQIKAAFLFNFVQFVEWPAAAFPDALAPVRIGVLGEDPFGSSLQEIVQGEKVHDRNLVLQRSREIEDLKDCHLLFICKSERARVGEILSEVAPRSVLTVSEVEGFAQRGGIINLYLEANKVRFEINPTAAQLHGLKISSQLLSLGKIVGRSPLKE